MPVVTTLMGIGAVDTTDPLSMRMLGMHGAAFANYAVDDCDCLLTLGARFDDRVAGKSPNLRAGAKFIAHFDIDASEIDKVKRVNWNHVGLMSDALRVSHGVRHSHDFKRDWSDWHRHCGELRANHAMNYDRVAEELARRAALAVESARLRAQVRDLVRSREDLLAIVSHDMRNPLGVVLTSSALLLRGRYRRTRTTARAGRSRPSSGRSPHQPVDSRPARLVEHPGRASCRSPLIPTTPTVLSDALVALRPPAGPKRRGCRADRWPIHARDLRSGSHHPGLRQCGRNTMKFARPRAVRVNVALEDGWFASRSPTTARA